MILLHSFGFPQGTDKTYPCRLVQGCPVAEIGGVRVLLDTGSPVSFGDLPRELERRRVEDDASGPDLLGSLLSMLAALSGDVLGAVRTHIAPDIGALAGTDVLGNSVLAFDWVKGTVALDARPLSEGVDLEQAMGSPVADVAVSGRGVRCVIDTGSARSYFGQDLLEGDSIGTHEDFYPMLGRFTVPLYRASVGLGGAEQQVSAATLPAAFGPLLGLIGVQGIIGMDVLAADRAGRLVIDLPGQRLALERG